MGYSRIFGSNFPDELIPVGNKKDIDDSVKTLVKKYYEYIDAGNLDKATELYNANYETLSKYSIDVSYINRLEEELYNAELLALKGLTTIISDDEPDSDVQLPNSIWLKEY